MAEIETERPQGAVSEPLPLEAEPTNEERSEPELNSVLTQPEGEPEVSEPEPAEAIPPTQATPTLPEGCSWVDATSYTCPPVCVPQWPVPSAVNEEGWLDLYTRDGRQLCGDIWGKTLTDGCGRRTTITIPCPDYDLCAGEGVWSADGSLSEERFICARCRQVEDTAGRCSPSRPVLLRGCINRDDPRTPFFPGCEGNGGEPGMQCCARLPRVID